MNGETRIAVVGAGPGGLSAAMILAHRGFKVDVFESRQEVGGRNSALRLGPYKFDVGPTFLMMKFILDEVFEEAGAESSQHLRFVRLNPMYRLDFGRFTLNCVADREAMKAEIQRVAPGRESAFDAYWGTESRRFAYMAPCLQQPYITPLSLVSKNLRRALPYLSLTKTVHEVLSGYFGDPDLALCFSFQSKYLGMSAWECPGAFAMLSYIEYAYGVYHTIGGLSEISAAMAKVAQERGAQIRLATPVQSLWVEGRQVKGIMLPDGERLPYDEVIVNADFGWAAENLVPAGTLRKWAPDRLSRKKWSCSTFMLYLGLDKTCDLPHHSIFMARDYRKNVEDVFRDRRLSEDLSFYVRNASVTDPTLAPDGHSALYVLVPVPNLQASIDWTGEKKRFRQLVLDTLARRAGLGSVEPHIREECVITPEEWSNGYRVYRGATFNLAHNLSQMLYLRPHNRFEELDCCYLTGGGTHPGSGVPTILESGRIAANLISRKHGVKFQTRNLHA